MCIKGLKVNEKYRCCFFPCKVSKQTHPLTVSRTVCPHANRHQTFPGPCSSLQLILSSVTFVFPQQGAVISKPASIHTFSPSVNMFDFIGWLCRHLAVPRKPGVDSQLGPRRRWWCPPLFSPPLFPKASGHWYCHLLFSTSLVKWLSRAGAFCSFSVTSVPY